MHGYELNTSEIAIGYLKIYLYHQPILIYESIEQAKGLIYRNPVVERIIRVKEYDC